MNLVGGRGKGEDLPVLSMWVFVTNGSTVGTF